MAPLLAVTATPASGAPLAVTVPEIVTVAVAAAKSCAVWSACTPSNPRADSGTSFTPFAALERLEVRGGRPGTQDWEWGLGTNTQQAGAFAQAYTTLTSAVFVVKFADWMGVREAGLGVVTASQGPGKAVHPLEVIEHVLRSQGRARRAHYPHVAGPG